MFFALYDSTTGKIAKSITGPDLDWANQMASEYSDSIAVAAVDREPDSLNEKVDLTGGHVSIVPFIPDKSPEDIRAEILAATQRRLDEFAQSRGYDSILSATTYAGSVVQQFASEGQQAAIIRDQTWAALYQMLAEVQAGTRAMPAGFTDIENDLPKLAWEENN
jgi:hypothetical protein